MYCLYKYLIREHSVKRHVSYSLRFSLFTFRYGSIVELFELCKIRNCLLTLIQKIWKSRPLKRGKIRETKYEVRKTRTLGKPETFLRKRAFVVLWKTTDPWQLTNEKVTRRTTSKSLKYSYGTYILFRNSFRAAFGVESSRRIASAAIWRGSSLLLRDSSSIPSSYAKIRSSLENERKKKKNWDC